MSGLRKTDVALLNQLIGVALLWPDEYAGLLTPQGRRRILAEMGVSASTIHTIDALIPEVFKDFHDLAAAFQCRINPS